LGRVNATTLLARRPHASLRHVIDRYWAWDAADHAGRPLLPVPPGPGGLEMVVHQGQPLWVPGEPRLHNTAAQLIAVRTQPLAVSAGASTRFFAIRLRAAAAPALLGRSLAAFTDRLVDVDASLPLPHLLANELRSATRFDEQCARADTFLIEHLSMPQGLHEMLCAAQALEREPAKVADIAQRSGWSWRQFEARFKASAGVAPSRFRRLARWRRSLRRMLLSAPEVPMTQLLDVDYFDQAQFVRDCHLFVGHAPGHFRRLAQGAVHFYLPSLPG
jgi:AraC-like DNA-binding protein